MHEELVLIPAVHGVATRAITLFDRAVQVRVARDDLSYRPDRALVIHANRLLVTFQTRTDRVLGKLLCVVAPVRHVAIQA